MKYNVAIDGPSGAGKSVIALKVAQRFNLLHIDSGAMYRVIALKAKQNGIALDDEQQLVDLIKSTDIKMTQDRRIFMDDQDVTTLIRHEAISLGASAVSKLREVRRLLVLAQQELAKQKNCIMEGRDIGTVVLRDAEVKIFLTAQVSVRAKRRYLDLLSKGLEADLEQIKRDLILRDYQDSHRKESPLKKAADAIELDSSHLSIDEVVDAIGEIINSKVNVEGRKSS